VSLSQPSLRGANGSRECAPDDRLRDEAIYLFFPWRDGLLRCARNDGTNWLCAEENRMKQLCVHIVANKRHGTLYTGVTANLPRRAFERRQGLVKGFSAKYGCKIDTNCTKP
jgi:hypothetical protein